MKTRIVIIISFFAFIVACAPTTKLTKTWKDSSLTPTTMGSFNKILVIAKVIDDSSDRVTEDKIVERFLTPGTAVQSYTILNYIDTNFVKIEEKGRTNGFDGIIQMHSIDINKSLKFEQGSTYDDYYGMYGTSFFPPAVYYDNQALYIETNIYSLETRKLLWSGTTSTEPSETFDQARNQVINLIVRELKKDGLIKGDIKQ